MPTQKEKNGVHFVSPKPRFVSLKWIGFYILLTCLTTSGCVSSLHKKEAPIPQPTNSSENVLNSQDASASRSPGVNQNTGGQGAEKVKTPADKTEQPTKPGLSTDNLTLDKPSGIVSENSSDSETSSSLPDQDETALQTPPTLSEKTPQSILDKALDYCELAQNLWQQGELDSALEALDQAYAFILSIQDIDTEPKLVQQKEDLRFLISKRILEIYASRHIVVNGDYKAIPIEINQHVQNEIDRFTKSGEAKFFKAAYKRSGQYRPFILEELRKAGLPEELSWLPLIESGYKVKALSKARALGLWQFIPSTGYKFGLTRNKYVDNRLDPTKATMAAIAYLKELHQIFGDWSTVLAAYNCGEGRVLREIRSQNINYLDNFWDLYARLPRETARYVPRFIATLHIINHPTKYGLDTIVVNTPIDYETTTISKRVHLKQVANAIGVSTQTLKALNPELRYHITPPDAYDLKVPKGKGTTLLSSLSGIPTYRPPQPKYVYHRVRRGETVSTIARKYRTSAKRIAQANRLNRRYTIVAGKKLKIPFRGSGTIKPQPAIKQIAKANTKHRVRKGDSLWNIARRYRTTVNAIKRLNHIKGTSLSIGQVLKITGSPKRPSPSKKNVKAYRVRSGDSPYQIARRNRMSLASFLQLNRLTPRSKIYPGQKVYVE